MKLFEGATQRKAFQTQTPFQIVGLNAEVSGHTHKQIILSLNSFSHQEFEPFSVLYL